VGVVSHNLKDIAQSKWSTPLAELFEDGPEIRAEYEDQKTIDRARRECHEIEGGYRQITVEQARAILSILGAK
jgi:hypothetical protein